jgi:signal peptidase I
MRPLKPVLNEVHSIKCEMAAEVLRTSGLLRLQVSGWSMLPTICPGDRLIIERSVRAELTEGDIVLVSRDRRLFVHRLLSKGVEGADFQTRGDAMRTPDPPVGGAQVLGRISYILRNGRCIEPQRTLSLPDRVVANFAQRSGIARIIVGIHNLRQNVPSQTT